MKSNYKYTVLGSILCAGASVIDIRSGLEVVRIDFQEQDGALLCRRAAEIIRALDRIDRARTKGARR